jgi:tetratricopeptide (TPR) repeat protein
MRCLVFSVLAASLASAFAAEDDLFTGAPPEKVPADVQRFLTAVKKALEYGEPADVMKLAHNQGMTGTAWMIFRDQLPSYSKEKPLKVKRIEMMAGAGDDAAQFKAGSVVYKRAVPATHMVSFTVETSTGQLAQFELPSAKVANANNNNVENWRLLPAMPQLPADSTIRLEAAKARVEAEPATPQGWSELAYLHGVLGHREEVEKCVAQLAELTRKKPLPYVEVQLGWTYLHLGELPKALEHFKKGHDLAAAGGGRYWLAEYAYAAGLFANGQTGEAVKHFDRAAGTGTVLTDRKAIEEWLKNEPARERELALGLFSAWARTTAPLTR